jgi:hypothetical protein
VSSSSAISALAQPGRDAGSFPYEFRSVITPPSL